MGYAPYGVTGDAIKMSEHLKKLTNMKDYLLAHPEEKEYDGKSLQDIEESIKGINGFEFLP